MVPMKELVRWTLEHAIQDRIAYFQAIPEGDSHEEETRREIEKFQELLRLELRSFLNPELKDIMFKACVYAEMDRGGLLDSVGYKKSARDQDPHIRKQAKMLKQLVDLRKKRFGLTHIEVMMRDSSQVSIFNAAGLK